MTDKITEYLNLPRSNEPYETPELRLSNLLGTEMGAGMCEWVVTDAGWLDIRYGHLLDTDGLWTTYRGSDWELCEGLSAQDLAPLYEAILTQNYD